MTEKSTKKVKQRRKIQLSAAEQIAQDMEMARLRVLERWSYQRLADAYDFADPSGAYKAVMRSLKSQQLSSAQDLQQETIALLDEVTAILVESIRSGKTYDAERLVRVLDKRDRYVPGIEVPIEVRVENVEQERAEAEALVSKFRAKSHLSVVEEAV